jgi:alkanesulfonate monooxygenase SsuD/methylene tetrahydromethanopterin reductase-like flavin-dependent oxidoreductase (luciferase family)
MMARQAMAIDLLSGGRMILGVGAGWNEYEHKMFGYPLGDTQARMDRFEEGLAVTTQLIRSKMPVTFGGKYFRLHEAELAPRPARPTRILVGGGGPKRTMPLVARYADIWNFGGSLETFKERSALLDNLLEKEGRKPGDVKRTIMVPVLCWRNQAEMNHLLDFPQYGTPEENLGFIRDYMGGITGEPSPVIEQLHAYAATGVDEIMVQWFFMEKLDGIQILAEEVLPVFQR